MTDETNARTLSHLKYRLAHIERMCRKSAASAERLSLRRHAVHTQIKWLEGGVHPETEQAQAKRLKDELNARLFESRVSTPL